MKPIFQEHKCLSEETIQGYLDNRLSAEERHRVENHLLDCPLCSDAVEGYELLAADQQAAIGKKPVRIRALQWRMMAAAAALLALIAAAVWIFSVPDSSQRLFAEFYHSYDNDLDLSFRQSGDETATPDTPLTRGLEAYMEQDFEESTAHLEAFLNDFPESLVARFYLGLAQMEQGKYAEAIEPLEAVRAAHREYWEEASWYLALAYLGNDDQVNARQSLEALVSPGSGRYYEEAKELISKL